MVDLSAIESRHMNLVLGPMQWQPDWFNWTLMAGRCLCRPPNRVMSNEIGVSSQPLCCAASNALHELNAPFKVTEQCYNTNSTFDFPSSLQWLMQWPLQSIQLNFGCIFKYVTFISLQTFLYPTPSFEVLVTYQIFANKEAAKLYSNSNLNSECI